METCCSSQSASVDISFFCSAFSSWALCTPALQASKQPGRSRIRLDSWVPQCHGLGLCWWCLRAELQDGQAAALNCCCHAGAMGWPTDSLQTGFLGICPRRALSLYLTPYATKVSGTGGQPECFILGHWELSLNQSHPHGYALREPGQGVWWPVFSQNSQNSQND